MHEDQYHKEQREQVEDNTKRITALEKKQGKPGKPVEVEVTRKK
ncbi:hypothetical protein LCGC14_1866850 [marine sediment metagenome]|uniref:Uncharacterized protein n=1 Tax=marine sediment metagenome TaxID=412755 RepID=A0A0F9G657_9ZZZZ